MWFGRPIGIVILGVYLNPMFEKWNLFSGSKAEAKPDPKEETVNPVGNQPQQATTEQIQKRKPATLEDIDDARRDIFELKDKRQAKLDELREQERLIKAVGVKEFKDGSSERTETFIELTSPIMEELKAISAELGKVREEFDMQPTRAKMLEDRIERLKALKEIQEKAFRDTEAGKKVLEHKGIISGLKQKIIQLFGEHPSPMEINSSQYRELQEDIDKNEEKISRILKDTKEGLTHIQTIDRINSLWITTEDTLAKAKGSHYDELGHNQVA